MVTINIPGDEQRALAAIDPNEVGRLVDEAVRSERLGDLRRHLGNCGVYISTRLHEFQQALIKHQNAKAARKRAETLYTLQRAARDLTFAVSAMKQRMETEQKESELFLIDDHILAPYSFSRDLRVTVGYRWRKTLDDPWNSGRITFLHMVETRQFGLTPAPKRKPSKAKQESDLQDTLYREWEHLMRGSLYSVRDYFRAGGAGEDIPETFKAVPDSFTGGLNNHSMCFWVPKS